MAVPIVDEGTDRQGEQWQALSSETNVAVRKQVASCHFSFARIIHAPSIGTSCYSNYLLVRRPWYILGKENHQMRGQPRQSSRGPSSSRILQRIKSSTWFRLIKVLKLKYSMAMPLQYYCLPFLDKLRGLKRT
jgi:hypothetical protein